MAYENERQYTADQQESLVLVSELAALLQKYQGRMPFLDAVIQSSMYAGRPERDMPDVDRAMFLKQGEMIEAFRQFLYTGMDLQLLAAQQQGFLPPPPTEGQS